MPRRIRGGGRGQRSSVLQTLFAQLHEAEFNLDQASGGLEAQFLSTSTELEKLVAFGDRFVKQVEKLVGLATGEECDDSVFGSAIRLVEQTTEFMVGCQEETCQMLALLRNYNVQIEHLLGVETELQRTMLPLRFVQSLFKAESAPLGAATQEMFGSLTEEIEGLHSQVREIFGTKFKQLEQTHRTIGQVIALLDPQARSLQEVTTAHKAQIESSLATLKEEMIANRQRDARLALLSKALAKEVEQVVIGLQFQDIISQKLQHVSGALPQIEGKFTEFQAAPKGATAQEALQYIRQSCRLEAGQLEAAQEEFAKAESGIQAGVKQVLGQLTETDSQCLSLEEFKLLTTSFDGMVQVLLDMIGEVRKLVAAAVANAAEAYEMLRPLGSLASDLTAIIREMSARLHLIGLNAQIQAARAAQDRRGASLEVLSARTSEISSETNRISAEAAQQLDALAAGLAESVKALQQRRTDGVSQQTVLNEQGQSEEARLRAFRNSALETLCAIGDSLDAIREQAQATLATVQFTRFHQVTLPALRAPLVAIADAVEGLLGAQHPEVARASLVEGFKRDYTMSSEREVFASVLSASRSSGTPPPSATSAVTQEIELFTDAPAGKAGAASLSGEHSLESAPATASVATAANGDLGANVELF